jgi:hypothetical protein
MTRIDAAALCAIAGCEVVNRVISMDGVARSRGFPRAGCGGGRNGGRRASRGGRDVANLLITGMVSAYFLFARDQMMPADIATVMAKGESWVRYATDYIERRMSRSHAFRMHIEQDMAAYAIATGRPVSSAEEVDPIRERIAGVVGVKAVELVAFERGNDAEIMPRVAAYLLLSKR